jgi:hypothetical protein
VSTGRQVFTYQEALALFPRVRDLTTAAVRQIEALYDGSQSREELESRQQDLEMTCLEIVGAWTAQVSSLGCEVKGLWLVDFDSGGGYYCWRYPEEALSHFHSYEDGFDGRMPIN